MSKFSIASTIYFVGFALTMFHAVYHYECRAMEEQKSECRTSAVVDGYMNALLWPNYWIFEMRP